MKNINKIPPRFVSLTDALCGIQEDGETIMATGIIGTNESGDVIIPRHIILDIGHGIVSKGSPENPQSKTILMRKAYYSPDTGEFLYEGVDVGDGLDYFNINTYNLPLVEYPSGSQPDTFEEAEQWQAQNPNKDVLIGLRQLKEYVSPSQSYVGDLSETGNSFPFECGPFILSINRGANVFNCLASTKDGTTKYVEAILKLTGEPPDKTQNQKIDFNVSQSSLLVGVGIGELVEGEVAFEIDGYKYSVSVFANYDYTKVVAEVRQSKVYPKYTL